MLLAALTFHVLNLVVASSQGQPPQKTYVELKGTMNIFPTSQTNGPGDVENETLHPFWNMSHIAGSRYEAFWKHIQPNSESVYGWNDDPTHHGGIDAYLDKCDAKGKVALLSVNMGVGEPTWFKSLLTNTYTETGPSPGTMAFPWDPIMKAKGLAFIQAMGARYELRTALRGVVCSGLGQAIETYLCTNSTDYALLKANAIANGFTRTGFEVHDAWISSSTFYVNAFLAAFPNTTVLVSISFPVQGSTAGDATSAQCVTDLVAALDLPSHPHLGLMNAGMGVNSTVAYLPHQLIHDHYLTNPAGHEFNGAASDCASNGGANYRDVNYPSGGPCTGPPPVPDSYTEAQFRGIVAAGVAMGDKFMVQYEQDIAQPEPYITDIITGNTGMANNAYTGPNGLYYFVSQGTVDSSVAAKSAVDGVVVGAYWDETETARGTFNFTNLDARLDAVMALNSGTGKPMRITISTGSARQPVSWLFPAIDADGNAGKTKYFTYETTTIPVFWEPTYEACIDELVTAIANHIRTTRPAAYAQLKAVFVPTFNGNTDDFNLLSVSWNTDSSGTRPMQRWHDAAATWGYSDLETALEPAGKHTYATYRTVFPEKYLTTSIGRLDVDPSSHPGAELNLGWTSTNHGRNLFENILTYANAVKPGYIITQKNNLSGHVSSQSTVVDTDDWYDMKYFHDTYSWPTAAQMVWKAYSNCATGVHDGGDPNFDNPWYGWQMRDAASVGVCGESTTSLVAAIDAGVTYHTKWQEVYEDDIKALGQICPSSTTCDPNVATDAVTYAHTHLPAP